MADSQRKTANLFDKDNADTQNIYVYTDDTIVHDNQNTVSVVFPCQSSTTYTISKTISSRFAVGYTESYPQNGTRAYSVNADNTATTLLITTGSNAEYIVIFIAYTPQETKTIQEILNSIMINEGQTALPYEPYGWVHSLRKLTTATDTLSNATAIPTTEGANSITVDTAVQPSEFTATWTGWHDASVKEKSENLFDTFISGIAIDTATGAEVPSSSGFTSDFIAVDDNSLYSYSGGNNTISTCFFAYDSAKAYIGCSINTTVSATTIKTVTTVTGEYTVFANNLTGNTNPIAYIRVSHLNGTQTDVDSETIMLNTGSTALPYEPYWK